MSGMIVALNYPHGMVQVNQLTFVPISRRHSRDLLTHQPPGPYQPHGRQDHGHHQHNRNEDLVWLITHETKHQNKDVDHDGAVEAHSSKSQSPGNSNYTNIKHYIVFVCLAILTASILLAVSTVSWETFDCILSWNVGRAGIVYCLLNQCQPTSAIVAGTDIDVRLSQQELIIDVR